MPLLPRAITPRHCIPQEGGTDTATPSARRDAAGSAGGLASTPERTHASERQSPRGSAARGLRPQCSHVHASRATSAPSLNTKKAGPASQSTQEKAQGVRAGSHPPPSLPGLRLGWQMAQGWVTRALAAGRKEGTWAPVSHVLPLRHGPGGPRARTRVLPTTLPWLSLSVALVIPSAPSRPLRPGGWRLPHVAAEYPPVSLNLCHRHRSACLLLSARPWPRPHRQPRWCQLVAQIPTPASAV